MSLSKNQLKLITSLQQKKYRQKYNLFVAEGTKVVKEFLNSNFEVDQLFCVDGSEYSNVGTISLISENDLNLYRVVDTAEDAVAHIKAFYDKYTVNVNF